MQQLFIPNPSESAKEALVNIGYDFVPFTDAGSDGILTIHPVQDLDYVATAFQDIANERLVADVTPPEHYGITRARALTEQDLKSYSFTVAADALLNSLELRTPSVDSTVQQYREQLNTHIRTIALLNQERIDGFDPTRDLRERMVSEFNEILKHPKVTGVEVGRFTFFDGLWTEALCVSTSELRCQHPIDRNIHSIGAFKITLALGIHTSDYVMWKNLTRRVNGCSTSMHAPHVWSDGHACLGNMTGVFQGLLARGDYYAAVDMAIKFIESVNITDGAGKYLFQWPIVSS